MIDDAAGWELDPELSRLFGAESLNGSGRAAAARFRLLSDRDLETLPDPTYLIDGVLPAAANVTLYGPSGEGKSFLALDWALSIAGGLESWMGRRVHPGPVIYLTAEGTTGLKVRRQAWGFANRVRDPVDIRYICDAVQLLELTDTAALLAAIEEAMPEPPVLIVLDTLARCMVGGDENLVKDVSRAIASTDLLRRRTGATVLLVHHSQKQGDLERGSSALRGAQDVMLSLKNDDGALVLESTKVKDGPPLERMLLQLLPVLGSCVITSQESAPTPAGLTRKQRDCLEAFDRVAIGGAVAANIWLKSAASPDRTFYRLVKQLADLGYVEKRRGVGYALTPLGKAALLPTATSCHVTATAALLPTAMHCHTPVGGGSDSGSSRIEEELRERAAAEGATAGSPLPRV